MQFINHSKSKLPFYVALSFTFILASCGSYQYVGYDNDGIYGSEVVVTEQPVTSNNSSYYKNYFAEKSQQLEIPEEDIIFTDIDSYEGDYNEVEESNYVSGNVGWGQVSDNVTFNYYNNDWGWNNWGWNNWGWNNWGWNNWGWNVGWSFYGYPNYWNWYTPYYGWGYYGYPYYGSHYYYNGYRNVAYNAGRRGTTSYYNTGRTSNYTTNTGSSLNRRGSVSTSLNRRGSESTSFNRRNSISSYSNRNVSNSRSFLTSSRRSQTKSLRPGANINNQNNTFKFRPRTNSSQRPNASTRNYSSSPRRSYNNSSGVIRSSGNSSPSINRSSGGSSSRSNFSSSPRPSSGGSSGARSSSSGRRGNQ